MGNAEDREAKKRRQKLDRDAKRLRMASGHRNKLAAKRRDEKKDGKAE